MILLRQFANARVKKCTSLLLAFLLLVSTSGLAFNVHYCGDSISSISLKPDFHSQQMEKDCCGKLIKDSHCCKNKTVHFQKKSNITIVKAFAFQSADFVTANDCKPIAFTKTSNLNHHPIASYCCDAHAPPLFKLFSQYLFYDRF